MGAGAGIVSGAGAGVDVCAGIWGVKQHRGCEILTCPVPRQPINITRAVINKNLLFARSPQLRDVQVGQGFELLFDLT